ncbi:MAG: zinc ribbon domain-containing protein [Nanoarchaeota archaeon]
MEKGQKVEVGEHKFCPVCGTKLKLTDTFCVRCGYSFAVRAEKNKKKKVKLRNALIIIVILAIMYFGLRYANGQTLFPRSLADAVRTIWPN